MGETKIRKPVTELSMDDLDRFPVWEFALDEEGEDGQDETTVRPYELAGALDPDAGMFVVRAVFRLADGGVMRGYVTPPFQGDGGLGTLQPIIVSQQGHVSFWWGRIQPPLHKIAASYQRLGRSSPGDVFPIRFSSDAPVAGGPVAGEVPGFLVLEDWKTGTTRIVT